MPTSAWSTTAASNGATLGIDIAENCDAANINNALREMMAQLKTKLDAVDAAAVTLDATLVALGAVTTAANKLIYATGVDTFATTDFSSFARTLLDDGDAAAARTTLAAIGLTSSTIAANTIDTRLTLSDGTTLIIKGGTGSLGANTTGTLSFGVTFGAAPVVWVGGGPANPASEGSIHSTGAATTADIAIQNSSGFTATYNWLALGRA
jgi:hypothetical protein